jgi:hypothetical protein
MYRYETHLHTSPVSACAGCSVRENLEFYKALGYDGVFITNHFIDGNISCDRSLPYEDKVSFYFSDYEEGLRLGEEIGIKVFAGVEISYGGTDFLVYGLDKEWFLAHPEYETLYISEKLALMAENGGLIIQAHPFREASYINHIRLFPRHVAGVEVFNACRSDFENQMAEHYAKSYNLIPFAGSDNHQASAKTVLGGMESATPIKNEADFIEGVLNGSALPFKQSL